MCAIQNSLALNDRVLGSVPKLAFGCRGCLLINLQLAKWKWSLSFTLFLPYFCLCTPWSIESSSQCKYHCTARTDQALSSVQVLVPCCYFCLQWKCSLSGIYSRSAIRSCWLPWLLENPLRSDFYPTSQPSSLRDAFSRQIRAGAPLQEGNRPHGKLALISIGGKQQGPSSQHGLGLRLKSLFLSLAFLAVHF